MKKIFTLLLVLTLFALAKVNVFGENIISDDSSTAVSVKALYQEAPPAADVMSVDIIWGSMDFTYVDDVKWDPIAHDYVSLNTGSWNSSNNEITITNHSNVSTIIKLVYVSSEGDTKMLFNSNENYLLHAINSAVGTSLENAPKATFTCVIDGNGISQSKEIGKVVITVSKPVNAEISNSTNVFNFIELAKLGGTIKLTESVNFPDYQEILINPITPLVIDLNNHTLTCRTIKVEKNQVTFKNGSLVFTYGELWFDNAPGIIENCNIEGTPCVIETNTNVTIKNSSLKTGGSNYFYANQGSIILEGNITILNYSSYKIIINGTTSALNITKGTYNFDPTTYVDSTLYNISQNTDTQTWTVTSKE